MSPPPICDSCRRVVVRPSRVALLNDGAILHERNLCSACRVYVVDCFDKPAPWIGVYPGPMTR